MKPVINPALLRTGLTALGSAISMIAAADSLTWQTAAGILGGVMIGWMRRAPNHVDLGDLPAGFSAPKK